MSLPESGKEKTVVRTPIYIVTGFLGSGKTTLVNNLLHLLPSRRVGMIFNEFGEINVDAAGVEEKGDYYITPLNNGQIFCSCLSGKFVDSVLALRKHDIDYLLVESSGLAKPRTLQDILREVKHTAEDFYEYKGMICVIDAVNFLLLSPTVSTISEQIYYSDLLVVNKTDLITDTALEKLKEYVMSIKPDLPIIFTSYGRVDERVFQLLEKKDIRSEDSSKFYETRGKGKDIRVVRLTLYPQVSLTRADLEEFLRSITAHVLRIKGFLQIKGVTVRVNAVGKIWEIQELFDKKDEVLPKALTVLALAEEETSLLEIISRSSFQTQPR